MKRLILMALVLGTAALEAQPVMVPTLQVCNFGNASGTANVYLSRRDDFNTAGTIDITVADVGCDPNSSSPYPTGTISMRFHLSESSISDLQSTLIEQMTTFGKHTTTTIMNGRCTANGGTVPCHFWLMLVNNKVSSLDTPADVVSVLVVDKNGIRLTYGTGPVKTGDISVTEY
ncbi:MAG TPA: hypothetical protein VNI54_12515 [Thermoanaerobaculia bacterium]|nr:hypothetical protein [Thermoanaerobaculia bacterium]